MGFGVSHASGRGRRAVVGILATVSLVAVSLTPAEALAPLPVPAQTLPGDVITWEVESTYLTEFGVTAPQGLAYSAEEGMLLVLGAADTSTTPLTRITPLKDAGAASSIHRVPRRASVLPRRARSAVRRLGVATAVAA